MSRIVFNVSWGSVISFQIIEHFFLVVLTTFFMCVFPKALILIMFTEQRFHMCFKRHKMGIKLSILSILHSLCIIIFLTIFYSFFYFLFINGEIRNFIFCKNIHQVPLVFIQLALASPINGQGWLTQ